MRKDADLKHLFTGPRTGEPGRPRVYVGKVSLRDFSRWDALPWVDEGMVYTVVAHSVRLKRQVRVVAVVWPGSRRTEVLFSTSTEMTAATIIALYRARFSMEFPFWDGKQFARLSECQSRQLEALHFHWNMALMAVSAARLSQLQDQRACPLVFSMEDQHRRAYNAFFAGRISSILKLEQSDQKREELLTDLLALGVKAA
ncbi:transposase (plasmid) [Deinococcus radiomollis]|uniref:transposase n=1 Tax=Deinococcus radiomollis TaxID=468916 RepID=UPI003891BC8C